MNNIIDFYEKWAFERSPTREKQDIWKRGDFICLVSLFDTWRKIRELCMSQMHASTYPYPKSKSLK